MAQIRRPLLYGANRPVPDYPASLRTIAAGGFLLLLAGTPARTTTRTITEAPARLAAYDQTPNLRTLTTQPNAQLLLQSASPPQTVISGGMYTGGGLAPISAPYPVSLRTTITGTLGLAPLPAVALAGPAVAPTWRPAYPPDLRQAPVQSFLTTTSFVSAAPPFRAMTETPAGMVYPAPLRTFTQGTSLSLQSTAVTRLPGQQAFENPATSRYHGPSQPAATNALLPNQFTAATSYIFRTPIKSGADGPIYPLSLRTVTGNLLQSTLIPGATAPFVPMDLTAPTPPNYPLALRTTIAYVVQDFNTPPQPPDTSYPRGPVYPLDLRSWIANGITPRQILATASQASIQEAPRGPVYPIDLRTTVVSLLQSTLFVFPANPPGKQVTEPPRSAPYPGDLRTTALNLQASTLFVAPLSPLTKAEFPNPRTADYPRDLRTTTLSLVRTLSLTQPFTQHDWPLPTPKGFQTDLRTLTHSLVPGALTPPVQPVGQQLTEWTRQPFYPVSLRVTINDSETSTLYPVAFFRRTYLRAVGGRSDEDNG